MDSAFQKEREEAAKKTHQGFTITCDKCGGKVVIFECDIGFSPESGAYGGIHLVCKDCDAATEIYGY